MSEATPREIRIRTFALTWLSYASYYLTRKNFSVAKKSVMVDQGLTKQDMAHIDTGYLAAYSLGQFFWGFAADRVGPRRVIGLGMLATAGLSVAFGMSAGVLVLTTIWTMNGFAQASGWAPNVKAMEPVPPPGRRGQVMGWWTTNYVIGGLVAAPIAAMFLARWKIPGAFAGPAVMVALVGGLVLLALPEAGRGVGPASAPAIDPAERRAARRRVLRSVRVWVMGASYFFMKTARYALLFWLPFYGETALGYSNAAAVGVSLWFEIGGAAGAILIGHISDRFASGRRFPIAIASLVCLAGALALYGPASHGGYLTNIICLTAIGFFLFGPDAILSGAAAQDLGGPAAAATAAGIINGMGSIGPVLGSEFWTKFSTDHGWNAAFMVLGAGALAAALLVAPFWNVGAPARPQV